MKFERIAQVALIGLVAAACSGSGEAEQVAPPSTEAPLVTVTVPEVASTVPEATIATTSTTIAPPTPSSLAFASGRDVGRLFQISGTQRTFEAAGGGAQLNLLPAGTLIQATSARNSGDDLWVRVRDASSEENYGWLRAQDLSPTTLFVESADPDASGELRAVRRSADPTSIVRTPGGSDVVATLDSQEIAMHGGGMALASTGQQFLDVIDPLTQTRIGWIEESSFQVIRSNRAQNQDQISLRTGPDRSVTYGAPLRAVSVSLVGCNAAQVRFANPSASLGLAVVLGQEVPYGREVGSAERWTSQSGGTLYVAPGDTATLTLATDQTRTWYFASLDADGRADANRDGTGSLIVPPGARGALSTSFESVELEGGSCLPAPVVDPDAYDVSQFPVLPLEDEDEDAEDELDGPLAFTDEDSVDGEQDEGSVDAFEETADPTASTIPADTTTTTSTTTTTTTTTTTPPTTTTTTVPDVVEDTTPDGGE